MICGTTHHLQQYNYLPKAIQDCFAYAQMHNLANFKPGRYEINGETLFVNITEGTTTYAEQRFWEAHRAYLDLHLILSGTERIDFNFIDNMQQKPYVEADDFLPMEGEAKAFFVLEKDDFLLCNPHDAHRTGICPSIPGYLKKAIFKIKL